MQFDQVQQAVFQLEEALKVDMPEVDRLFLNRIRETVCSATPGSGTYYVQVGMASETAIKRALATLQLANVFGAVDNFREGLELEMKFDL